MARRWKFVIAGFGAAMLLLAGVVWYAQRAVSQVQPFYQHALEAPSQELAVASKQLESRVAALFSDSQQESDWQAAFTDAEVNGWLAVALAEKYTELLPPEILDPRVAFTEGRLLLGFRFQGESLDTVISVDASVRVTEADVIAIRLHAAHAGRLPIPRAKVVEHVTNTARRSRIAVRWSQVDDDPVALIPLEGILSTERERRELEAVELRDGELFLAGKTVRGEVEDARLGASADWSLK